ncbi:hypothetical protein D3C76_1094240 [compost metagenome]
MKYSLHILLVVEIIEFRVYLLASQMCTHIVHNGRRIRHPLNLIMVLLIDFSDGMTDGLCSLIRFLHDADSAVDNRKYNEQNH